VDRLWRAASALSDLFTTDRPERFPDYAADEDLRLAYGLYFAPQTWVRVRFPLAEAVQARGWRPPADRALRVLDLGAGLGTAGWSAAQWCVENGLAPGAALLAVDRSPAALDALSDLARPDLPCTRGLHFSTRVADFADVGGSPRGDLGRHDLVVLSFALNEAFPEGSDAAARTFLLALRDALEPGGLLLVVEPALRGTSERLRALVRPLVEAGAWHVLAPDLNGRVAGPPPDPRFFDHEVRRWRSPGTVRTINRRLARSLDELTFSFLALSSAAPAPLPATPRRTRLTSPLARLKGRLACTGLDTDGARSTYDLLERHLSGDDRRRLAGAERGDHVQFPRLSPLREAAWFRVPDPSAFEIAWHPE
jgi:SAM-dependent methyltransferase